MKESSKGRSRNDSCASGAEDNQFSLDKMQSGCRRAFLGLVCVGQSAGLLMAMFVCVRKILDRLSDQSLDYLDIFAIGRKLRE